MWLNSQIYIVHLYLFSYLSRKFNKSSELSYSLNNIDQRKITLSGGLVYGGKLLGRRLLDFCTGVNGRKAGRNNGKADAI